MELIGNPKLDLPPGSTSTDLLPPKHINRHFFNETHEHIDMVYFGRAKTDTFISEPGVPMRWFSKEDIEQGIEPISPGIRAYALAALRELEQ